MCIYVYCVYTVSIRIIFLMIVSVLSSINSFTLFSWPFFFVFPGPRTVSCHTALRHLCGPARNSEDRRAAWDCTGGCGLPPLGATPKYLLADQLLNFSCALPLCELQTTASAIRCCLYFSSCSTEAALVSCCVSKGKAEAETTSAGLRM